MTTLIKNTWLIDGTGRPPVKADVLIKNDRISAIGFFPRYQARNTIDARGAYLSPGFIDINTSADLYLSLFSNPQQEEFLKQGVTTIAGGQNGISLAPLFYGALDFHKFWAAAEKINISWHSFGEFSKEMVRKNWGVNFASLVGYSTLRKGIIGDDFRDLETKELDVVKFVLGQSLSYGAFGISFDLSFPSSSFVPFKEIKTILDIIAKHKSLAVFRIRQGSDLTSSPRLLKENFLPSVEEIIGLAKNSGARVNINNFICHKGLEEEYKQALDLISGASSLADISFDLSLRDYSLIPLLAFFPSSVKLERWENLENSLRDNKTAEKIKKEIRIPIDSNLTIFNVPEFAKYLKGKTLKEFCQTRELDAKEGLVELARLTKMRAVLRCKNVFLKTRPLALSHDKSIVSSSATGMNNPALKEEKETFEKFLEKVGRKKLMPWESAVKKITYLPAQKLMLKDRGAVKENFFADLVLFRDEKIEMTMVNGQVAWRDGEIKNKLAGRFLKRT